MKIKDFLAMTMMVFNLEFFLKNQKTVTLGKEFLCYDELYEVNPFGKWTTMSMKNLRILMMLFVGLTTIVANPGLGWATDTGSTTYLGGDDEEKAVAAILEKGGDEGKGINSILKTFKAVANDPSTSNYNNMHVFILTVGDSGQEDRFEGINKRLNELVESKKISTDEANKVMKLAKKLYDDGYEKVEAKLIADGETEELELLRQSRSDAMDEAYYQMTDSYGNRYIVNDKEEKFATQGNFKGCETINSRLYKQRECFFCPLFQVIYKAVDRMAVTAHQKLSVPFATVMALGLAIWIAFQTLTHVSSLTKQDAPKFLGNLMKQSFKFLIAFLILTYMGELYAKLIVPLLDTGLKFGKSFLINQEIIHSLGAARDNEKYKAIFAIPLTFFSKELYYSLEDFITSVQQEIAFMQSIGTSLLCIGSNKMMGIGGFDFGVGFSMTMQGLVLAIFGFLLSLAFAFYLIDAVVQLGIVGALMPFLVACWPFKLTAQYTSKGFGMILNSFFVFVFVGLVVSINLELVQAALGNNQTEVAATTEPGKKPIETPKKKLDGTKDGALAPMFDAINRQAMTSDAKGPGLKELTDISGTGFLILIFCCIFGFKFSGQSSALAEKMAGGGIKGIGTSIGTMGASAVTSGAKKLTQPVREAAWDKTVAGAGAVLKSPLTAIGMARRAIARHKNAKDENGGDNGGNGGAGAGGSSGGGASGGNKKPVGAESSQNKGTPNKTPVVSNANSSGQKPNNNGTNPTTAPVTNASLAGSQPANPTAANNAANPAQNKQYKNGGPEAYKARMAENAQKGKGRGKNGGKGSKQHNQKISRLHK